MSGNKIMPINIFIVMLSFFLCNLLTAEEHQSEQIEAQYLAEIKQATALQKKLWNIDLYGPILLVDQTTRRLVSNHADSENVLTKDGDVYTGVFPKELNIANTSIFWNGNNWAMIMLPLSTDKHDRINLLAHELFHRAQSDIGFKAHNPSNNHLNEKQGRILLRLELEALKKAVKAADAAKKKLHLSSALSFRKLRFKQYPDAAESENLLELNEGLAEYTGLMVSAREHQHNQKHLINSINSFFKNPSFVRSFAYVTTPVYGYLLAQTSANWNLEIKGNSNLTDYFVKAYKIELPQNIEKRVSNISNNYNGEIVRAEETERELRNIAIKADYMKKFVTGSHLVIHFENMNISFDPRNIYPLNDLGVVYPNIRVTDNWGILTVTKGALMSPNWNKITTSKPIEIKSDKVTGDGWVLELTEGYGVEKEPDGKNYKIAKLGSE